jgi:peptide/nickel transport system permease protein
MAIPLVPVTGLRSVLHDVVRTKAGVVGLAMLAILLGLVLLIPFIAPYDVVSSWRDRQPWVDNPRDAPPEWSEIFGGKRQVRTQVVTPCSVPAPRPPDFNLAVPLSTVSQQENCPGGPWKKIAVRTILFGNYTFIDMTYKFAFNADVFPSEMSMSIWANYSQNAPLVRAILHRPDGVNYTVLEVVPHERAPIRNFYPLSTDDAIKEDVRNWAIATFNATDSRLIRPEVTLFAKAGKDMLSPLRATVLGGVYTLTVDIVAAGYVGMEAKLVIFGTVFGLAGTDSSRHDLLVGLLWGAPIALAFGTVAAVVIVVLQTFLGALATWFGGWWDEVMQRGADTLLIIPILPILLLIGILYHPSIWLILLVLVALGFLGTYTKVARSIVLQVKEEAYIESAISYGASRTRILLKHILPRLMPYIFGLVALSVPAFIFLEASLSFLGFGDPLLPSWGNILGAAYNGNAAQRGFWWWILLPTGGIVFATVAFALLGYSFDKVLNPRLREQ